MLVTSQTTDVIDKVLHAIQMEIENPKKDSENPYFNSRYTSLPQLQKWLRKYLGKRGILVIQGPQCTVELDLFVTRLKHIESGEWIEVSCRTIKMDDPQKRIAFETYMARNHLMRLLNLSGDDDDNDGSDIQVVSEKYIQFEQIKALYAQAKKSGWKPNEYAEMFARLMGVPTDKVDRAHIPLEHLNDMKMAVKRSYAEAVQALEKRK